MDGRRYRVAQWATGHTGVSSLRSVIDHPQFELVGVYVYSDAKVGRDAGELCGTAPTGVSATNDIDAIISAKPDCVITQDATHRYRAIGTLTGITAAFLICALVLMGGQDHRAIGIEWLVVAAVAGAVYVYGYVEAVRLGGSVAGSARVASSSAPPSTLLKLPVQRCFSLAR